MIKLSHSMVIITNFHTFMVSLKNFKSGSKNEKHQLFTWDEYYSFLTKVKTPKDNISHKTPENYLRLSRFDTAEIRNLQN